MKKKKMYFCIVVVIIISIFLMPIILRNVLRVSTDKDPWHMMDYGIVKDVGEAGDYYIVVDIGEECDYKLYPASGKTTVFNKYNLPCSGRKIERGMTVEFYSKSAVVYDESNYAERGEKRTDVICECLFIWID